MRRLVYYAATTLDGFVAGPDGGDPSGSDFFPVTDDGIRFVVENYPETLPAPARHALGIDSEGTVFDTVVEGRRSYEIGLRAGLNDAYPHLRHVVFSTTLPETASGAVEIVRDDPIVKVRELKLEEGLDIWLVGGGTLAHALLPEIDRLILKVNPSIIGSGISLFNGLFSPTLFTAVDETLLPGGVRVLTYDRR